MKQNAAKGTHQLSVTNAGIFNTDKKKYLCLNGLNNYLVQNITIVDESTSGPVESFTSFITLYRRLISLKYTPFINFGSNPNPGGLNHNDLYGLNEGNYQHLTAEQLDKLNYLDKTKDTEKPVSSLQAAADLQVLNDSKAYTDSKLSADYSNIVYFNSTDPDTATIFDTNNPPVTNNDALKNDVTNLYIDTDSGTWVYDTDSGTYKTEAVTTGGSNFKLSGTSIDAGNNKDAAIERTGAVGVGNATASNHAMRKDQVDVSLAGKEDKTNKTDDIEANKTSSVKYSSAKSVVTWLLNYLFSNTPAKTSTLVDADLILAGDSEDTFKTKTRTWVQIKASLKSYFDPQYKIDTISIAMSDTSSVLLTGDADSLNAPYNFTLLNYWIAVKTAPTATPITVDIKRNGTSITSTKASIDPTEKTSLTGTSPVLTATSFVKGDEITPYVFSVGSGESGRALKLYLEIIKT
ncbi:MAG: hypothetical protein HGA42_13495 [Nostocales cyanobacterium W4_Combined_metabat2_030]|nr:hypothetical protein [Nostocales cyanobacterium W4_Combined_metabat2_030]